MSKTSTYLNMRIQEGVFWFCKYICRYGRTLVKAKNLKCDPLCWSITYLFCLPWDPHISQDHFQFLDGIFRCAWLFQNCFGTPFHRLDILVYCSNRPKMKNYIHTIRLQFYLGLMGNCLRDPSILWFSNHNYFKSYL